MTDTPPTTETDASDHTYMLVQQTDYDQTGNATYPGTYLQLGAYPAWGDSTQRGDDLLSAIGLTTSTTSFFKDDHRYASSQTKPATVYTRDDGFATSTSGTPQQLTAELMTRGGWRLHTDGNYLSTTRGDRVDVIFGNYHLAVLGRTGGSSTAAVWTPAYWESSGGHTVQDDVARRGRVSLVEWDSARSAWKSYHNTLKGNHTRRFQGPLEHVFEVDTYRETIGSIDDELDPDYDSATDAAYTRYKTIPATSASAHQQTDAATNWVNPSTGVGSNWPRRRETPNLKEDIAARSYRDETKVTKGLGAASSGGPTAGSITRISNVMNKREVRYTATGDYQDLVYGKGADVTERTGYRPDLQDDGSYAARQKQLTYEWKYRFYGAEYTGCEALNKKYHAPERQGLRQLWDNFVLSMEINLGVHVEYTDHAAVEFNTISMFMPGYYDPDRWDQGAEGWEGEDSDWIDDITWMTGNIMGVLGITSFGTGETELLVGSMLKVAPLRASLRMGISTFIAMDHLRAFPKGAFTEAGLFKMRYTIGKNDTHVLTTDATGFELQVSPINVRS